MFGAYMIIRTEISVGSLHSTPHGARERKESASNDRPLYVRIALNMWERFLRHFVSHLHALYERQQPYNRLSVAIPCSFGLGTLPVMVLACETLVRIIWNARSTK